MIGRSGREHTLIGDRQKIAVISAINPGNSGMYSVDLAAIRYFTSIGRPFDLVRFQNYKTSPNTLGAKIVRDVQELADYEVVVYWGDFQNNPMYGLGDFSYRDVHLNYSPDRKTGAKRWAEFHLLAAEALAGKTKIMSLGNCFLGAQKYLDNSAIKAAFDSFVAAAHKIAPREDQSLRILTEVSDPEHQNTFVPGMDMATLLAADTRSRKSDSSYFVYAFARTGVRDTRFVMRELATRTNLTPVWLPWLDVSESRLSDGAYAGQRDTIADAQFVITDIYHCALNTLNVRTPLICIAMPGQETINPLSDTKKFAALEAYGLTDLLVYPKIDSSRTLVLKPAITSIEERIEKFRSSDSAFEDILQTFDSRRTYFRNMLNEMFK
jgi:hypothetical protein